MNTQTIYSMGSKLTSSTFQARAVGLNKKEDSWKLIKGEYESISLPVKFKQVSGKNQCDILDTGWVSLLLISEKMKKLLESYNLTGWNTYPIELSDKDDNPLTGYYGLSITGRSGAIDYKKCEIIERQMRPNAPIGKYRKGLAIELETWDGSDFFLPLDSFYILVTEKAAKAIKKESLTNLRLIKSSDVETLVLK